MKSPLSLISCTIRLAEELREVSFAAARSRKAQKFSDTLVQKQMMSRDSLKDFNCTMVVRVGLDQ